MTPKEKAKELLWKYLPILEGWKYEDSNKAKQCALIAVDEIIKQLTPIEKAPNNKSAFLYWQEVKQEIENL
jgi:hypothetical protein